MSNESYKSDIDTYELFYHGETDKAVKVSYDDEPFWLPKSQVACEGKKVRGGVIKVTIPEWLAEQHDLL